MNSAVIFGVLVVTLMSSVYQAQGNSVRLDQVVRALDALYKRQATSAPGTGGTGGTGGPGTTPSYVTSGASGEYSEEYSSEGTCASPVGVWYMVQEVKDQMFIQHLRTTLGSYNGICLDLFSWLEYHYYEEDLADESQGFGSMDGGSIKKKSSKYDGVKRKLRGLLNRMEKRSGEASGYMSEGSGEGGDLHDGDIRWHSLFMSCYVWVHLSDEDIDGYYK